MRRILLLLAFATLPLAAQSNSVVWCDQQAPASSQCFTLSVPATIAASFSAVWPASNGTGALTNNGSGVLTWTASGSSGVANGFFVIGDTNVGPPSTATGIQEYFDPTGLQAYVAVYKTPGVATTVAANIATGSQTVTPASMTNIVLGTQLTVANSDGSHSEIVTVTGVTGSTFTATFTTTKTGPGITVTSIAGLGTLNLSTLLLNVTGATALQPAIQVNNGWVQSNGGFVSSVSGGSWQGINSNTDGALLRGYGVAATVAGTAGGYMDFAPITYSPSPGYSCYDAFSNPVAQPAPLNGLGAFGTVDTLLWNSASPMQSYRAPFITYGSVSYFITGTRCATELPTAPGIYGLNTNAYLFANGGLASGVAAYNAIQAYNGGGVLAQALTASGLYPPGQLLPSGFIANPFDTYTTLDTTTGPTPRVSNQYGTFLGGYIYTGFADSNPGEYAGHLGSAGTCTDIATCDNPFVASEGPKPGEISYNTTLMCEVVYNGTAWVCIGGNGAWTLSGTNLYPASTTYAVLVGENSLHVMGATLEVAGQIATQGANAPISSSSTGTNHAFTAGSNFIVNGNGDITASGNLINTGYITTGTWLGLPPGATAPATSPGSGYGALSYNSGSTYWYYNATTPGWATVDMAALGGPWTLSAGIIYPTVYASEKVVVGTNGIDSSGAVLQVTGTSSLSPAIEALNGWMQSYGGFVSSVPGGSWQAFNSNMDGALLRGYGVAQSAIQTGTASSTSTTVTCTSTPCPFPTSPTLVGNSIWLDGVMYLVTSETGGGGAVGVSVAPPSGSHTYIVQGNTGGYVDFAPNTYPPTVGQTCYDAYGNLVSQPRPLNGLSAFGASDVLMWVSESPLQGYETGTWTINAPTTANYYLTGTPCAAPIPVPPGTTYGINSNSYFFSNSGFASGNTAYDTLQIFTGGAQAGSFTAASLYPPGTLLRGGYSPIAGVTIDTAHGGTRLSNQYGAYLGGFVRTGYADDNPGGSTGTCTSIAVCDNPLPSPGPLVPGIGLTGTIYFNTVSNCEMVYNGASWGCIGAAGGYWSLAGSILQPTNPTYSVDLGDTTHASIMQVWGAPNVSAVLQVNQTGGSLTPFQVDGLGDISAGGITHIQQLGSFTSGGSHYQGDFDVTYSGGPTSAITSTLRHQMSGVGYASDIGVAGTVLISNTVSSMEVDGLSGMVEAFGTGTNAVGLFAGSLAKVANASAWAVNSIVSDYDAVANTHVAAAHLKGWEMDINSWDSGTLELLGLEISGNGQYTGSQNGTTSSEAIYIHGHYAGGGGNPGGDGAPLWGYAVFLEEGSSINGIMMDARGPCTFNCNGQASQQIDFRARSVVTLSCPGAGCPMDFIVYSDYTGRGILETGTGVEIPYNSLWVNRTNEDGSNAELEVSGTANIVGTIQSSGCSAAATPCTTGTAGPQSALAFQSWYKSGSTIAEAFSVNYYGDVSSGGAVNANGLGLVPGPAYQVNGNTIVDSSRNGSFANLTVTGACTGCGGGITALNNVTSSRLANNWYGNYTGHTIWVIIAFAPTGAGTANFEMGISIPSAVTVASAGGTAVGQGSTMTVPVLTGYTYNLQASGSYAILSWLESN